MRSIKPLKIELKEGSEIFAQLPVLGTVQPPVATAPAENSYIQIAWSQEHGGPVFVAITAGFGKVVFYAKNSDIAKEEPLIPNLDDSIDGLVKTVVDKAFVYMKESLTE